MRGALGAAGVSLSMCSPPFPGLLQGVRECNPRPGGSLIPQDPQQCPPLPAEGAPHARAGALHTQCPAPLRPHSIHTAYRRPQTPQHERCTRDPPATNP